MTSYGLPFRHMWNSSFVDYVSQGGVVIKFRRRRGWVFRWSRSRSRRDVRFLSSTFWAHQQGHSSQDEQRIFSRLLQVSIGVM